MLDYESIDSTYNKKKLTLKDDQLGGRKIYERKAGESQ